MNRKLWLICLGVWAIATGLLAITSLKVESANLILGVLLIATGILALLDK